MKIELITPQLCLRPLVVDDRAAMAALFADGAVRKHLAVELLYVLAPAYWGQKAGRDRRAGALLAHQGPFIHGLAFVLELLREVFYCAAHVFAIKGVAVAIMRAIFRQACA